MDYLEFAPLGPFILWVVHSADLNYMTHSRYMFTVLCASPMNADIGINIIKM